MLVSEAVVQCVSFSLCDCCLSNDLFLAIYLYLGYLMCNTWWCNLCCASFLFLQPLLGNLCVQNCCCAIFVWAVFVVVIIVCAKPLYVHHFLCSQSFLCNHRMFAIFAVQSFAMRSLFVQSLSRTENSNHSEIQWWVEGVGRKQIMHRKQNSMIKQTQVPGWGLAWGRHQTKWGTDPIGKQH